MSKIRINDLARELEVKSRAVLEYLPELGISDKKSHSSAIDEDVAERVRAHFRGGDKVGTAEESARREISSGQSAAVPATVKPPTAPPRVAALTAESHAKKIIEQHFQTHPLTRSLADIKAEARRHIGMPVVPPPAPTPKRPAPSVERLIKKPAPEAPAAGPSASSVPPPSEKTVSVPVPPALAGEVKAPAVAGVSVTGAVPAKVAPTSPFRRAARSQTAMAAALEAAGATIPAPAVPERAAPPPTKPARIGRGVRTAASGQPLISPDLLPKGVPARPPHVLRRPGEPRPTHPTSARAVSPAAGGIPAPRPPLARPPLPMPTRAGRPGPQPTPAPPAEVPITREITISEGISIKELSEKLDVRAKDVIKRLLDNGIFATINQTLDSETARVVSRAFGAETLVRTYEDEVTQEVEVADGAEDLLPRPPVVTVMGHVDHGKTSLLDAIRETNVVAKEAGGITQSIGAYQVEVQNRRITFIDTPGHEAFTLMRARGAKVTDVVVLVVAADDGVMPQTLEAIDHARAAKVPIVVAINKIDKPEAMPERVKKQLADHNLMGEEWGGDTVTVEVSAKKRQNIELLLEMILLVADMQVLKANPKRLANGTVLEARLDRGRGPVATVLVENGTLHVGDPFIVGAHFGKVRAMFDDRGMPCTAAPPSTPVEVLGLEDVPQAGDRFQVIEDTTKARQIALHRQAKLREAALAKSARLTLEQLHEQLAAGDVKELPLIIKGDVQGSVEVLTDTLNKLSTDKVKIKVIHTGVGAVTETDVLLAAASNAVIIGFSVRPERKAAELAQLEKVDIRLHTVIYEVTEEIKKAMVGLLPVTFKETNVGRAVVRDTFRITKVGTVAGCYIQDGKAARDAKVRLLRDNVVIYEGKVRSLRHFKEDVAEVKLGMECGVALENYNDVKIGDVIEFFVTERVAEAIEA